MGSHSEGSGAERRSCSLLTCSPLNIPLDARQPTGQAATFWSRPTAALEGEDDNDEDEDEGEDDNEDEDDDKDDEDDLDDGDDKDEDDEDDEDDADEDAN